MVARAALELEAHAPRFIALAREAGAKAACAGTGIGVGVVVVERDAISSIGKIVAVAGDGRFSHYQTDGEDTADAIQSTTGKPVKFKEAGNVLQHAVLRAIGMVAEKRRLLEQSASSAPLSSSSIGLTELRLGDFEEEYFHAPNTLAPNGYLCVDLVIYLTHEPCVMCSMAILHSRFSRVVFARPMPRTGALSAEADSLGYGLFWRESLNWKMLCWRWEEGDKHDEERDGERGIIDDCIQV